MDSKPLHLLKSLAVAVISVFQMFYCLLTPSPKKDHSSLLFYNGAMQFKSNAKDDL
jgi:hypothetical protein